MELMQTDDVSKIAAQIANQAELIYQAWKTTDLNPNELIHYHSVAPDRSSPFRQTSSPQPSPLSPTSSRLSVRSISPAPPGSSPAVPRRIIEIPISTEQSPSSPFQHFPHSPPYFQHAASPSRTLNASPRPYVPGLGAASGSASVNDVSPSSANRSIVSISPQRSHASSSGYNSLPRTSPPAPPERSSSYSDQSNSGSPTPRLENPEVESSLRDLVTNFVLEDKARHSRFKGAPSTIQDALQKFEKQMAITSRAGSPADVVVSRTAGGSLRATPSLYSNNGTTFKKSSDGGRTDVDSRSRRSVSPSAAVSQPGWNETSQTNTSTWPLKHKASSDPSSSSPASSTSFVTTLDTKVNAPSHTPSVPIRHKVVSVTNPTMEEEKLMQNLRQNTVVDDRDSFRPYDTTDSYSNNDMGRRSPLSVTSNRRPKYQINVTVDIENNPTHYVPTSASSTNWNAPSSQEIVGHLSNVDYAKVRFQDAQQHPKTSQRMEDYKSYASKPMVNGDGRVLQAKNRFEVSPPPEIPWRTLSNDGSEVQRRKMRKTRKSGSPEPSQGSLASLPHPELTDEQKAHIRERTQSPAATGSVVAVRPFLTQGSVAERVMLFEKAPGELKRSASAGFLSDKKRPMFATWRDPDEVRTKAQDGRPIVNTDTRSFLASSFISPYDQPPTKDVNNREVLRPSPLKHDTSLPSMALASVPTKSTIRRSTKNAKNLLIPRFYFPLGRPSTQSTQEEQLDDVRRCFCQHNGQVGLDQMESLVRACNVPLYWKVPLFVAAGGEKLGFITQESFTDYWGRLIASCHDSCSRFVSILSGGSRNYLLPEDFIGLIQDVVDTHPGVTFLKEATEFHSRYVHTVIARIYYCVNRSWSGRITIPELRRSNLLQVISYLEEEEDINKITDYFSYEHFYVIYCKFWELDTDHDLFIDKDDLAKHNEKALSWRIIERIFSGAVTRCRPQKQDRMGYQEFVWFLMAEEDKRHPTAIEYWFRCMDLDGDGFLSMYELEYFYEEQMQRMESFGIETLPFSDCLCQMLDMVRPEVEGKISLRDLKKCRMTPVFFDTFFNLEKYLDHEQRDPFACQRLDEEGTQLSDWDKYAAEEYELLVAEEGGADQQEEMLYGDEDELSLDVEDVLENESFHGHHEPMVGVGGSLSKHSPLSTTVTNLAIDAMDVDDDYADSDEYHY